MGLRLSVSIAAGKAAGMAGRRLGRGGTALPGLVATTIDGQMVGKLGRQIPTRLLVTGTNGKTTTCRALSAIFAAAGRSHLHNREGSNMVRGFASTLLHSASSTGKLDPFDIGLFETDEATLPAAVEALQPQLIAFTNLFRDQLDRYGEVDTVAAIWREALSVAPADCCLVLNADDPLVASLADDWSGPVHFFGVDSPQEEDGVPEYGDARWCSACRAPLAYERRFFAHIGRWRCDGCGRAAPELDTVVLDPQIHRDSISFILGAGTELLTVPLAGAYNVYNATTAIAVGRELGLEETAMREGLSAVEPPFGRQEVVEYEGRRFRLLLSKNPAGANEVLRFLRGVDEGQQGLAVAVLLNDRFADSRDVSWVWDVDYERLAPYVTKTWTGGLRAEEMALRLKYAGWPAAESVLRSPGDLLDGLLKGTEPGDEIFVLPTYTAMLDLRAVLVERGAASPYWGKTA